MKESDPTRTSIRVLVGVLIVCAVLLVTHRGEFWPASIYPMFSSADRSWSRALVVEVTPGLPEDKVWRTTQLDRLPGPVLPLNTIGVSQNALSAFVAQPRPWGDTRRQLLRRMFSGVPTPERHLLVYRVRGALNKTGRPVVTCFPVALLTTDSLITALHRPTPNQRSASDGSQR